MICTLWMDPDRPHGGMEQMGQPLLACCQLIIAANWASNLTTN